MIAGWLSKGLLAFLLTFAMAETASAQTKSADLPVPHRVNCIPVNVGQASLVDEVPTPLSQSIADVLYATKSEFAYVTVRQILAPLFFGVEGNGPVPDTTYYSYALVSGPWSGLIELFR